MQHNQYSHLTAKERSSLSFPANYLLRQKRYAGRVLDMGCGFGKDVELLAQQGIDIVGYDTYYFPDYPNIPFFHKMKHLYYSIVHLVLSSHRMTHFH